MQQESIKKRFLITLIVNAVKFFSGILATTIVPRSLGPFHYGNYQYITTISSSARELLNFGSAQAFFTYNSKNKQSYYALKLYFIYLVFELILLLGIIIIAYYTQLYEFIYPDQKIGYVIVILVLEWLGFFSILLIRLGESKAESILVQKINLTASILKILVLFFVYYRNKLTLNSFILINLLVSIYTICLIYIKLIRGKGDHYFSKSIKYSMKKTFGYFFEYCKPLIIYTILVFLNTFFERWLLQFLNGSIQQAYFSLAYQWSSVALLFSSSLLNIYWREISFSKSTNDYTRIDTIIRKTIKPIYFISSVLAFYLSFNSKEIIGYFAGEQYINATSTMIVLAFYPIHQTIGQMASVYFLATENTKYYRNIGIFGLIFGILGTYFVLAPNNFIVPGLNMGSIGLAFKMVIFQIIFTNLYLLKIAYELKIKFSYFLKIQLLPIIVLFLISILSFKINWFSNFGSFLQYIFKSSIYFSILLFILILFPNLVFETKSFGIVKFKNFIIKIWKRHKC